MILLAIDTSGPNCAVWIGRGAVDGRDVAMLAEGRVRIGRGHAERLLPMVEEALQAADLAFADLDRIAVATGPGSFTGVRVGVAAARGLALALGIPAVGVGSLEALAEEARHAVGGGTLIAALAGPRGGLFAFATTEHGRTVLEPALLEPAQVATNLPLRDRQPVALIGSAAPTVADHLARRGADIRIVREAEAPEARWIARLALGGAGVSPPRPVYLRPADAKPQAGKAVARAG